MNEMMKRLLTAGRMDRRSFMASALAAGVTLSAAARMADDAMAAKPKQGGTMRFGSRQGETSDSMDPATYNNDFMFVIGFAVFSSLVELGPDGVAQPDLAESFESTPDARTWTFRLRDGVKFSDGRTVTARDVLASISYHMGEDSKSGVKPLLTQIEDMKADGDNTVVFTLSAGNADFPYIFNDYHLGIRPAQANGSIDPTTRIGSGGYTLESFEPGIHAVLKRRDDYWKPGRAHVDTVEIFTLADIAARVSALVTDQVDLIDRPDLKTIHMLERDGNIRIHVQNGALHYVLPMHTDVAPFTDNNVRMALKYAIDREDVVRKVLNGYGVAGNDQPITPSLLYHDPKLPARPYDPDRSKFHLRKSGLSSLKVDLHTADVAFSGAVDMCLLFSESARAAGIDVNVVREADDGYWSNVWLKKPFCASYWGGRPTADLMFTTAYATGAEWNESHFSNERFDKLLVQARPELDRSRRAEMYSEMQRLVSDEGGTIIPAFGQTVSAINKRVRKPDAVTQMWSLDGLRFVERWWLA
ncbi:MAG: ABC transporter substrate-binding protein [Parvibaculaceae bacterium]